VPDSIGFGFRHIPRERHDSMTLTTEPAQLFDGNRFPGCRTSATRSSDAQLQQQQQLDVCESDKKIMMKHITGKQP